MRKLPVWIERRGGLDFSCTQCGDCCTGAPGHVWVEGEEIDRLVAFLGLERDDFGRRFLRLVDGHLSLVEKPNGDCTFWERGAGCTVYPARPTQCRTYPFWPEVISSERRWTAERDKCPGVRGGGRHYGVEEIHALMNGTGETGVVAVPALPADGPSGAEEQNLPI
jgi:uncharacterized protein